MKRQLHLLITSQSVTQQRNTFVHDEHLGQPLTRSDVSTFSTAAPLQLSQQRHVYKSYLMPWIFFSSSSSSTPDSSSAGVLSLRLHVEHVQLTRPLSRRPAPRHITISICESVSACCRCPNLWCGW